MAHRVRRNHEKLNKTLVLYKTTQQKQMNALEKMQHIKELARIRQKKFYDLHKNEISLKKKMQWKKMKEEGASLLKQKDLKKDDIVPEIISKAHTPIVKSQQVAAAVNQKVIVIVSEEENTAKNNTDVVVKIIISNRD